MTIQWLLKQFTNIPTGSSDQMATLPITYSKTHFCSVVGSGTRVHTILTVYGRQPSYTRVGFANYQNTATDCYAYIISIGI